MTSLAGIPLLQAAQGHKLALLASGLPALAHGLAARSHGLLALAHVLLALIAAPLLPGLVNRTKSVFAGRKGAPLLQGYYDLAKLLQKGAVFSRTTTAVFRLGPAIGLATAATALLLLPFGAAPAVLSFSGDLVLFAYLLGLGRFATILAALDTGSAFEGMGASREAAFSALAEPALFVALAALARHTGELSLSGIFAGLDPAVWSQSFPALALAAAAIGLVFLAENSRIPIDDPTTHLELTMIHEVMVLDHSGPDLAFIEYGSALKLWVLGALMVGIVLPFHGGPAWRADLLAIAGMGLVAIAVGVIESTMARLQLSRVPKLLGSAGVLAALSLILAR